MKIKADTKTVEIIDDEKVTSGAYNDVTIEVELSNDYDGLTTFVTFDNIKSMLIGNKVIMPTLKAGICRIGVYGIKNQDGETILRHSPSPAYINVVSGSYNKKNDEATTPSISEIEYVYALIDQAIESGRLKGEKGDTGEKGEKGDKGDTGEQGPKGDKGDSAEVVTNYSELNNKPSINNVELNGKLTLDELNIQEKLTKEQLSNINSFEDKADKTKIIGGSSNQIMLLSNTEYRRGTLSSLTVSLEDSIDNDFKSMLVFKSGTTATNFICNEAIKWVGTDVSNNRFTPTQNKTYELRFWFNGININCFVWGI